MKPRQLMFSKKRWKLSPEDFKQLCRRAKAGADGLKGSGLETRMILIDAWNEYGEGHAIFSTHDHRFGYRDAIREVFSPAPSPHTDASPGRLLPYGSGIGRDVQTGGREGS